jgi:hypothetical protein
MPYYDIHYNKRGEPYVVVKNFGYNPKDNESSSHWTWHITARGVKYLSTGPFGEPRMMPTFIDEEQLENLKTFQMLCRSDGTVIGVNSLNPSDSLPRKARKPVQPIRPAPPASPSRKAPAKPQRRPIPPVRPAQPTPVAKQRGFWAWLKSLFGEK